MLAAEAWGWDRRGGCEETIEYQLKAPSYAEQKTDRRSKVQDYCSVTGWVQNTSNHHPLGANTSFVAGDEGVLRPSNALGRDPSFTHSSTSSSQPFMGSSTIRCTKRLSSDDCGKDLDWNEMDSVLLWQL